MVRTRELVEFARRHGFGRDEIVQIGVWGGFTQPLALVMILLPWAASRHTWDSVFTRLRIVYGPFVAVEFLTDAQAAGYGHFEGEPSRAELERFFLLDVYC